MKTISLLCLAAPAAWGLIAAQDTSLFRAGNTWTYSNSWRKSDLDRSFSGITRFHVLQRWTAGDTLRFRVAREDSGTSRRPVAAPIGDTTVRDMDVRTRDTTEYAFHAQAFTPSVPPFAVGQTFAGAEPRVVYQGDTLHLKGAENTNCGGTTLINLQSVGVVKNAYNRGCGTNPQQSRFALLSFNGIPFAKDSAAPVSILARAPHATASTRAVRLGGGSVRVRRGEFLYDLKGTRKRPAAPAMK